MVGRTTSGPRASPHTLPRTPCPPALAKTALSGRGAVRQPEHRQGRSQDQVWLQRPSSRGKRSAEAEVGEVGWLGFPFLGSDTVNIQKRQTARFISKDRSTRQRPINDLAEMCSCLLTIRGRRRWRADCGHSRRGRGHSQLCSHIWSTDLFDLAGESQGQGDGKGRECPL